jgi:hypothetical protein
VANNVSNALGAALASVAAVGLLSVFLSSALSDSELPPALGVDAVFDGLGFVTDGQLRSELAASSMTPAQVDEAVAINEEARLRALRATFLIVAALSLLSIFPAMKLPRYTPGELSAAEIVSEAVPDDTETDTRPS